MNRNVSFQIVLLGEPLIAYVTSEGAFTSMGSDVPFNVGCMARCVFTQQALKLHVRQIITLHFNSRIQS